MMNSTSTQFVVSRRMAAYEPIHQMSMWAESFRCNGNLNSPAPMIMAADTKLDNQSYDDSHGSLGPPSKYDQEATKPVDKVQRRLAQNREAARKSRLKKKAYVQQLEASRLKLMQLEQELEKATQQRIYVGCELDANQLNHSGPMNSGVIKRFEKQYGHWVEQQNQLIADLRTTLHTETIAGMELHILVESGMNHYFELFHMKAIAAKADVFYVMSGMWKTPAERLLSWIGGFRPSEIIKVLLPELFALTDQQRSDVTTLMESCHQTEDALSQGMERLRQTLSDSVAEQLGEVTYPPRLTTALEKLEDLVSFVTQADHIRREALQQMYKILTPRQAAQGLLVLGEYFQRLRALSEFWENRPGDPS